MKPAFTKLGFVLLWLLLFYELLFNPGIREPLLLFCKDQPLLAPLVLVTTQLVLASFALPCSPLSVLAEVLWGWQLGVLYSTLATALSSLWTFFLGRYVLRRWFGRNAGTSWWAKISALIARYQWKASMVAHANPIFPGSSLGYAFGASTITLKSFFFGGLLGTLPLQLITVALGNVAGKNISGFAPNSIPALLGLAAAAFLYKTFAPKAFDRFEKYKGRKK